MNAQPHFGACPRYCHMPHPRGKAWTEATVTIQLDGSDEDVDVRAHTYMERNDRDETVACIEGHVEALVCGSWVCASTLDDGSSTIDDITEALQTAALADAGIE